MSSTLTIKCNNWINLLLDTNPYQDSIALFRKAIMIFLLCNTLLLWPQWQELYSSSSYFLPYYKSKNIILKLLNLLENKSFAAYYLWFIGGQIVSIVLVLLLPYKRVLTVLVYFFTINLYHKTAPIQNAGFNLLVMLLFLLIFMNENKKVSASPYLALFNNMVSNIAFWLARFQVIILYAVASYYKMSGESWVDGTAFYYVLYNDMYSHVWAQKWWLHNNFVIYMVSYFTLLFQLLFPVLIWLKPAKKIMILLGIVLHLMIALAMGIVDFGIIMMITYLLFNSNNYNQKISSKLGLSIA